MIRIHIYYLNGIELIPLLIGFACLLIVIFLVLLFGGIYQRKKVFSILHKISEEQGYSILAGKKTYFDYIITAEEKKIYLKVIYVPLNAAITINSKDTWNLTYGGARGRPGKGYAKQRYLHELIPFLRSSVEGIKLVIIYPTIDKVQQYLNESEIIILNNKQSAHGVRFLTFLDLENSFKELL